MQFSPRVRSILSTSTEFLPPATQDFRGRSCSIRVPSTLPLPVLDFYSLLSFCLSFSYGFSFFFFFNTRPVRVPGARARAEVVNFSSGAVRILQKPATRSVGLIPRSYLSIISYGYRIYIVSYERRGSDYYLNN